MIKIGKEYTIFSPQKRESKKGVGFWTFSIGDSTFNLTTKTYSKPMFNSGFVDIAVFNPNIELQDRQKVTIKSINSFEIGSYNGKEKPKLIVELESNDNPLEEETSIELGEEDKFELPF